MSWLSEFLKQSKGIPEVKIDPRNPFDALRKAVDALPEEQRNEAGSLLIARLGGVDKFLDSLPPTDRAAVVLWVRRRDRMEEGQIL